MSPDGDPEAVAGFRAPDPADCPRVVLQVCEGKVYVIHKNRGFDVVIYDLDVDPDESEPEYLGPEVEIDG